METIKFVCGKQDAGSNKAAESCCSRQVSNSKYTYAEKLVREVKIVATLQLINLKAIGKNWERFISLLYGFYLFCWFLH